MNMNTGKLAPSDWGKSRAVALLVAGLWLCAGYNLHAQGPDYIIEQDKAPIKIVEYDAKSVRGSSRDKVVHTVQYMNQDSNSVTAIEFGFVSFGPFYELLNATSGLTMEGVPPAKYETKPKSTFHFQHIRAYAVYNGLAYVSRIRFAGGRVWTAELDSVAQQIRERMNRPKLKLPPDTLEGRQSRGPKI